jgi:uncharacterized protein YjbJ (UPF0337 family)
MNTDTIKGNWKQLKGKVKEAWGDLTDDELTQVEGKRDQLVGLIQKKYGTTKDEVEKQLAGYERDCGCS